MGLERRFAVLTSGYSFCKMHVDTKSGKKAIQSIVDCKHGKNIPESFSKRKQRFSRLISKLRFPHDDTLRKHVVRFRTESNQYKNKCFGENGVDQKLAEVVKVAGRAQNARLMFHFTDRVVQKVPQQSKNKIKTTFPKNFLI